MSKGLVASGGDDARHDSCCRTLHVPLRGMAAGPLHKLRHQGVAWWTQDVIPVHTCNELPACQFCCVACMVVHRSRTASQPAAPESHRVCPSEQEVMRSNKPLDALPHWPFVSCRRAGGMLSDLSSCRSRGTLPPPADMFKHPLLMLLHPTRRHRPVLLSSAVPLAMASLLRQCICVWLSVENSAASLKAVVCYDGAAQCGPAG